jgi:hypothetical protein
MGGARGTLRGEEGCIQGYDMEKLKEREYLEDLSLRGMITPNLFYRNWLGGPELDLSGLEYGQISDFSESYYQRLESIKCAEFLDCLTNR